MPIAKVSVAGSTTISSTFVQKKGLIPQKVIKEQKKIETAKMLSPFGQAMRKYYED